RWLAPSVKPTTQWWGAEGFRDSRLEYRLKTTFLLQKCLRDHPMLHHLPLPLRLKCPTLLGLWGTTHIVIWPTTTTDWEGAKAATVG
ncbi:hypothetical protein ILYODFUR_035439, partial [Ilyodon furcidens]